MVKKSKRISILVVLLPILMLLVGSIYFAVSELEKYLDDLLLSQKFHKVEKLEKLKQSIVNEIICVAKASTKKNDILDVCKTQRFQTDSLILNLKEDTGEDSFLSKSSILLGIDNKVPENSKISNDINMFDQLIKDIRYDIDTSHTININTLIYSDYYRKIINPIQKSIESMEKDNNIPSQKELLKLLRKISSTLYYTDLEKVFTTYYISNKKVIPTVLLERWDTYISSSTLPGIDELEDVHELQKFLSGMLKTDEFRKALDGIEDARIDMIANCTTGEYEVDIKDWIGYVNIKEEALFKAIDIILTNLITNIEIKIKLKETRLLVAAVVMFVGALFTVYLILYYFRIREEDDVLQKVVAGVKKLSLGDGTKESIPLLPQNLGNKKEVYTYLENILQLLHKKEMEAEEANQAKSQFLANMSHELRTPLNGIVGFTQLLGGTSLDEDQAEFVSIIENSSENLLAIINDILDISKISANKMDLEIVSFDIFEKVEKAIEIFTTSADEKNIQLGIYIDPTLARVRLGDPKKVSQVLTNLIGNALKFTPANGTVSITVKKPTPNSDNGDILFQIKDSGIGISSEEKIKIFEQFSQADTSTSRKYGGTGLGLSISSAMINLMGGELDVESEKNHGSNFHFTIKLQEDTTVQTEEVVNLDSLNVGLVLPDNLSLRDIDNNLKSYIISLNAKFEIYYYNELFNDKQTKKLPDVMFFYHKDYDEVENLLTLECPVILITTAQLKDKLEHIKNQFSSVIYSPVTLGKIVKVLSSISEKYTDVKDKELDSKEFVKFQNIHSLVAEDNPTNQRFIKVTLEKFGIDVTLVANGEEALLMRKKNDYDIIFMDIQMPIMTGVESTRQILMYEKENNLRHIPIVALTANALVGDKEKYIDAGMDSYLPKPIIIESLEEIIREYCSDVEEESAPQERVVEIEEEPSPLERVVEIENKEVKAVEIVDILLYISVPFLSKVYNKIFTNMNYNIDVVSNKEDFLDKLENTKYLNVVYDDEAFGRNREVVCDLILDTGAKSVMFVYDNSSNEESHSKILTFDASLEEIKKSLNS